MFKQKPAIEDRRLGQFLTGDSVKNSPALTDPSKVCGCGFNTPLVKSIEGRAIDFLYSTKGGKINLGNVSNIFKYMPNTITKAQLIQDSLTHMLVKIVVDGDFTNRDKKILTDEIKHKFGNDMKVDFEVVDDIPREMSGKYKLIVNKVKTNLI